MSMDDLWRLLRASAGVSDAVQTEENPQDKEFGELGYDSLAVLEVTAKIEQEFAIKIPEDVMEELTTPATLVEYVNRRVAA